MIAEPGNTRVRWEGEARAASRMTALEAEIRRIIAVDGPIPIADFMALVLGHPTHGYYLTRGMRWARPAAFVWSSSGRGEGP